MKKRLISLLLTLSMVFGMVPMLGIGVGAIGYSHNKSNRCYLIPYAYYADKYSSHEYFIAHYNITGHLNAANLESNFKSSVTTSITKSLDEATWIEKSSEICVQLLKKVFDLSGDFTVTDLYDTLLINMLLDKAATTLSDSVGNAKEITSAVTNFLEATVEVVDAGGSGAADAISFFQLIFEETDGVWANIIEFFKTLGKTLASQYFEASNFDIYNFKIGNKTVYIEANVVDNFLQRSSRGKVSVESIEEAFSIIGDCMTAINKLADVADMYSNALLIKQSVTTDAAVLLEKMQDVTDSMYLSTAINKYKNLIKSGSIDAFMTSVITTQAAEYTVGLLVDCMQKALEKNPAYKAGQCVFKIADFISNFGDKGSFSEKSEMLFVLHALTTIDAAVIEAMKAIEQECIDNYKDIDSVAMCNAYITGMLMSYRLQSLELDYGQKYMTVWYGEKEFEKLLGDSDAWEQWNTSIKGSKEHLESWKPLAFTTGDGTGKTNSIMTWYNHCMDVIREGTEVYYVSEGSIFTQQTKPYAQKINVTAAVPIREGYTFDGWRNYGVTYQPQEELEQYLKGVKFELNPCFCGNELWLNAQWSVKKDYITYNANKGKNAPISHENKGVLSTQIPVRNGYEFLGWDEDSTVKTPAYKSGATISKTGSVTLYAIWKPKSFDVIFDANGGYFPKAGSSTITKPKEYNQAFVIDVEEPKMDGYTFSGEWEYINPTTGVPTTYKHDPAKTYYSIGDSTLNAKVLKAVWIDDSAPTPDTPVPAPTYSILYNANVPDGTTVSNLPSAQTKNAGASITLASAKPSRSGYTFLGWHTDSTSLTADSQYAPGSTYSVDANLTLYAIWQQDKVDVQGTGIAGDINADNSVNNRDLVAFRKHLDQLKTGVAAAAETLKIDPKALDINGNGKSAEEADFETLFKYLTNWDVDIYYGTGDDIERYFEVTHQIEGDLLARDELEVFNGKAKMTWNINSSHDWKAESSVSWIYFDEARTVKKTSGSTGKQKLYIYLSDTQTKSTRTGKVKFTVDGETYTVVLRQNKAEFAVSHPDYANILKEEAIRLYNGSNSAMNWTVESSHNWSVVLESASSNWVKAEKIDDTTMRLTTLGYASGTKTNTAKVSFNVNGDTYTVEIYQSALAEPVTELEVPESVTANTIDHESISVSWNAVKNAEEYEVHRSTSRSSGYKCIATVSGDTEYIDSGLEADTKYYYKIKACTGDVKSDLSGYTSATTDEGLAVSFSVTHPDHGDLVEAGSIEVINGKAYMTWTINSSHDWEAETTMSWCYFNESRTKRETSGSAGKSTIKIYLDDSQTRSERTGKVKFTVNGETYTVKLIQKKAQISISHPNYSNIIKAQPIHLYNNADISMNWTIDSTHDWTVSIGESSANWIKVQKTSDTNLCLTTLWYASPGGKNTATILIYVNGDVYEIDIYQN